MLILIIQAINPRTLLFQTCTPLGITQYIYVFVNFLCIGTHTCFYRVIQDSVYENIRVMFYNVFYFIFKYIKIIFFVFFKIYF
jgi:hypothetical protein